MTFSLYSIGDHIVFLFFFLFLSFLFSFFNISFYVSLVIIMMFCLLPLLISYRYLNAFHQTRFDHSVVQIHLNLRVYVIIVFFILFLHKTNLILCQLLFIITCRYFFKVGINNLVACRDVCTSLNGMHDVILSRFVKYAATIEMFDMV